MAVTGIRVTMFFEDSPFGISESHIFVLANEITPAIPEALKLIKARMKIMGSGVKAVGCRLSKEGVFRDSQVLDTDDLAGLSNDFNVFKNSEGRDAPNEADVAKYAVLLRAESGTRRRKPIYLAGVPDVVIGTRPPGPELALQPWWTADFNKYKTLLQSGKWGFVAKGIAGEDMPQPTIVAGVLTQVGTGLVGIYTGGAIAGDVLKDGLQLRGFRMSHPAYPKLNGSWQVAQVEAGPGAGQTTYWLRNSTSVIASTVVRTGTAERIDHFTVAYTKVQAIGQTSRKRGNRFLAGPGRRRVLRPLPI